MGTKFHTKSRSRYVHELHTKRDFDMDLCSLRMLAAGELNQRRSCNRYIGWSYSWEMSHFRKSLLPDASYPVDADNGQLMRRIPTRVEGA